MSQITVENIKRSSETVARSTRGVAAAWVNFNGTGTIAARDSENVSSLTDNGTGDYTVNFSNAFAASNYCIVGTCGQTTNDDAFFYINDSATTTTSSIRFRLRTHNGNLNDAVIVNAGIHGDLA